MKTLRGRLWIGFGGLLLILVIVSTLSVVVLTRYSHALQQVFRENYNSALYCDAMKESLDKLDVAAQNRAWGSPMLTPIDVHAERNSFDENLRRQLANITLPNERQYTEELSGQWSAYEAAESRSSISAAAGGPRRHLSPAGSSAVSVGQTNRPAFD